MAEHIRSMSMDLQLEGDVYQVTPELVRKVVNLQFSHPDKDNLGDGIYPFQTCQGNWLDQHQWTELINQYDTLTQGTAQPSLRDLQVLAEKDKIALPATIFQALSALWSYQITACPLGP